MLVKDLLKGRKVVLRTSKANYYEGSDDPIKWLALTDGTLLDGQESLVLSHMASLEATSTKEAVTLWASKDDTHGWGIIRVPSFDECEVVTL